MPRRIVLLIVGTLIALILPLGIAEWLRDRTAVATGPVTGSLRNLQSWFSQVTTNLSNLGSLQEERAQLQQRTIELQQQLSDLQAIQRENESLRRELNVSPTKQDIPKILAQVTVSGINPLDPTFTISAGKNQGVQEGQPVLYQGVLLGRIAAARDNSAIVRSILSPKSVVQVWIPSLREYGVLVGTGTTAQLEDTTQGVEISPTTPLETSGLGGSLPQGIQVGTVGDRISGESSTTPTYRVQLGTNPSNATSVIVLATTQAP
jgi:rod shape-determining protein MreC